MHSVPTGSYTPEKGGIFLGKAIIRRRRLFHTLFIGGRAQNILFFFSIKSKIITSKKLNMGFLSVPNLVP